MAFLNMDPTPMLLPGFSRVLLEGRQKYAWVVIPRAAPTNEDLEMVTISNIPAHEVPFAVIWAAVLDLVEGEYGLRVVEIQRCPFGRGQAFVRPGRVSDRDTLIHHTPHEFRGLILNSVKHNRGPNARSVLFNREC
jgi:hypothetical protein